MPKYRSRATLQAGRRLDINELRRSGIRTGEFGVTFPGDDAPKGMRQATFERLWQELDRNEDVLNERLARVAARLMKWAR